MEPEFTLPAELVAGASVRGNEYGWPPTEFPDAAQRAELLGYACVGGQFQFRAAVGTCEMYWLSADSTKRLPTEDWPAYCARSRAEVLDKFHQIIDQTDFAQEAMQWPILKGEVNRGLDILSALVFVAYFETEEEWLSDAAAANATPA
ncbi:MAG: hypothetical protein WA294_22830 [Acidobacteriaceae bacterium]